MSRPPTLRLRLPLELALGNGGVGVGWQGCDADLEQLGLNHRAAQRVYRRKPVAAQVLSFTLSEPA